MTQATQETHRPYKAEADDTFRHHEVVEIARNGVCRTWRCHNPIDPDNCPFTIATIPDCLIVHMGGRGITLFERVYDMLPWARQSVGGISYLGDKVRPRLSHLRKPGDTDSDADETYTNRFLWCYEALCWFLEHHEEPPLFEAAGNWSESTLLTRAHPHVPLEARDAMLAQPQYETYRDEIARQRYY